MCNQGLLLILVIYSSHSGRVYLNTKRTEQNFGKYTSLLRMIVYCVYSFCNIAYQFNLDNNDGTSENQVIPRNRQKN